MSVLNLVNNNDDDDHGIPLNNETSPLIANSQRTAPAGFRHGPRHSISWVRHFFGFIQLFQKLIFSRIFRAVGEKLLEWIFLLLRFQQQQQQQ